MSCRGMEQRIALQISGDLSPGDERAVLEHLAACESCARLAADLRNHLDEMRSWRAAPVDGVALAAVRRAVLSELESRRARTLSPLAWIAASSNLRWAAVGISILVAAFIAADWFEKTHSRFPAGPAPMARVGTPPPTAEPARLPDRDARTAAPRRELPHAKDNNPKPAGDAIARRQVPAERNPPPPKTAARRIEVVSSHANGSPLYPKATLVKLASSDPDVVLYWLVESNGG